MADLGYTMLPYNFQKQTAGLRRKLKPAVV